MQEAHVLLKMAVLAQLSNFSLKGFCLVTKRKLRNMNIERWLPMLNILGRQSHNVISSNDRLAFLNCLYARVPGAVIKFRYFSTQLDTRML